jgi:hypothetical protein
LLFDEEFFTNFSNNKKLKRNNFTSQGKLFAKLRDNEVFVFIENLNLLDIITCYLSIVDFSLQDGPSLPHHVRSEGGICC